MRQNRAAQDGEEFRVLSNGGDWWIAWHPPTTVPMGKGSWSERAFCITANDGVVLSSNDGAR